MSPPAYIKASSLAKELEISESTVHDLVRRGVLPKPVRLSSGCVRWRWASVEAALASLQPHEHAEGPSDPFMKGVRDVAEEGFGSR